jgi:hypothetical protein
MAYCALRSRLKKGPWFWWWLNGEWWCLIRMELLERRCRLEWMIGGTICRTLINN